MPGFRHLLTWSLLIFASACEQPATETRSPDAHATQAVSSQPRALMQPAIEALCSVDLEGAASVFREDAICELADSQAEPVLGRSGQKALWSRLQLAFPDVQIQAKQILESPGFWVLEAVLSGTHQGAFLDQEPTQRLVGCQIAVFCWLEDDKIKRAFIVGNPDTIRKQMTLEPSQAPPIPEVPETPVLHARPGAPENARAVTAFFKAFESGDWSKLGELVSPKIVVWSFGDGQQYAGLPRLKAILIKEQAALQGRVEVQQAMAAGPYVAALVKVEGKLLKDLGPLKAGGSFSEKGVDVFRFEDGKIVEWRNYRNQADLIAQLSGAAEAASK